MSNRKPIHINFQHILMEHMCSYLGRLTFKSAFLSVQGTICRANAVVSVDKILTVLSGMASFIGKLVGEYRGESRRGELSSGFLVAPRTFFLWIFVLCGAYLPWRGPQDS